MVLHLASTPTTSSPSTPPLSYSPSSSCSSSQLLDIKAPLFPFPWSTAQRFNRFSLLRLRVSLEEHSPQTQETQNSSSSSPSASNPARKSIWVNPNSSRVDAIRRHHSGGRHTRLVCLSASLESSPGDISRLLSSFPNPLTELDAVFILNTMENADAAISVLRWFHANLKQKRDVVLFNVTLKVLRKSRDWDGVEALMCEMMEKGVKPDNVTFSTVISCARLCNLPEKSVEWFEKMPEFGLKPDKIIYCMMIDSYGRVGNVDLALGIYDKARTKKWRLDPVTFANVIRIYGSAGNFDGALNLYEEMKALGVKPNLLTYNRLLDAMSKGGKPWYVKSIYKEMIGSEILPSNFTYSVLIRSYSRARYAVDALAAYREMREKGMKLHVLLYNMLLSMCADIRYVDEAVELFKAMKATEDGCQPDCWSYSSLITAYACNGNVAEAERTLNEMMEAGFQPNIIVLTSIIQCYGKAKRIDDVVRSFDRLRELNISPDDRFCGCLLHVLTQTPRGEIGKVIRCIEASNSQLGSVVKLLFDVETTENLLQKEAEQLFRDISEEVRKACSNCLMDVCVNSNQLGRASLLLNLALQLGIYSPLQSKSDTQWYLYVKSLSFGAALTALEAWMDDMSRALEDGEELPPLLGIYTGHGKHKYAEGGLASAVESHLRQLKAPFYEAPDKAGWFLTTNIAAKSWLNSRNPATLVIA